VPGHEVVGELDDGTRVAIEPVLGHAARGLPLPFDGAAPGDGDDYGHLIAGDLEPGIQTGFCSSTGGGWAPEFVAHDSQLHRLGDVPDERAVLIEPLAGGIHAALLAARGESLRAAGAPIVAVLGAGTMGLAAVAGLIRYVPEATVVVGARYPHQQREARRLGAHDVVPAAQLTRAVRRHDSCRMVGDATSGGAHAVIDAVGSNDSIATALRITRPRGRTVLMGMPAEVTLDLTGLWHRETELVGAYTYGSEHLPDGARAKTFDLAAQTADAIEAERWVSATYQLADHVDAIAHASNAGRRGAIKIAFDLRSEN
jgi:threonine dehydrogenase-like Zn-dependent dehydrogenase